MSSLRAVMFAGLCCMVGVPGCQTGGANGAPSLPGTPGYSSPTGASSGYDPLDVDSGENLSLSAARGVELRWRDQVFRVGMSRGMSRARKSTLSITLPVASVDPGYHSGQVTVFRWIQRDIEEVNPTGETATRWLIIPVLLRPDRVLEVEQTDLPVEKTSVEREIIDANIAATKAALDAYPGGRWRMHAFSEVNPAGERDERDMTRVYMLADTPTVPDLDVLVADASRKRPARVLGVTVHHEAGSWEAERMTLARSAPSALTVARLVSRGELAREFEVTGTDGSLWRVHSETGEISLLQPGTSGSDSASDEPSMEESAMEESAMEEPAASPNDGAGTTPSEQRAQP